MSYTMPYPLIGSFLWVTVRPPLLSETCDTVHIINWLHRWSTVGPHRDGPASSISDPPPAAPVSSPRCVAAHVPAVAQDVGRARPQSEVLPSTAVPTGRVSEKDIRRRLFNPTICHLTN